jgi:hypothetical protein
MNNTQHRTIVWITALITILSTIHLLVLSRVKLKFTLSEEMEINSYVLVTAFVVMVVVLAFGGEQHYGKNPRR